MKVTGLVMEPNALDEPLFQLALWDPKATNPLLITVPPLKVLALDIINSPGPSSTRAFVAPPDPATTPDTLNMPAISSNADAALPC